MMLTERDPNGLSSGRASRASNLSARSRMAAKQPGNGGQQGQQDLLSAAAPGVMSMLRTSTEMGNVAGLTGGISDMANVPRAPQQRRGTSSRMSTASSISTRSNRTNQHQHHRHRPSSASAARHSMPRDNQPNMPQYVPDTLSPTMMNVPGSSPLVPLQGRRPDSHRAQSMTTATFQPPVRLSANRSLGSLHGHAHHQHHQRPRSPLRPPRYRRPNRPASPAWSDAPGSQSNRLYSHGHQMPYQMPYQNGQMRSRVPSDTSLGQQDLGFGGPRHPSRAPSPAYHQGLQHDVPPVPPLHQHYHPAIEQARMMQRSVKGSVSSGSTNMRTDSDTPSSDLPQPPTPRDNVSVNDFGAAGGSQMIRRPAIRTPPDNIPRGPAYYDYSEQFHREEFIEPEAESVPTGFVDRTKRDDQGRTSASPASDRRPARYRRSNDRAGGNVPSIAELPASPVPRPLTRALVLRGLEPASTTSDFSGTANVPVGGTADGVMNVRSIGLRSTPEQVEMTSSPPLANRAFGNRHSILSQAGSSVLDSSTLNFAVRHSIPAMAGNGVIPDFTQENKTAAGSPNSPSISTEDGMSELLAGYQHTDSKQEDQMGVVEHLAETPSAQVASFRERISGRMRKHAQNSSDGQSFKSCPEPVTPSQRNNEDSKSFGSAADVISTEKTPKKISDGRTSDQRQDLSTPARTISVQKHPANVPTRTLATDTPIASPKRTLFRERLVPRIASFSSPGQKSRSSSKPSIKQGTVSTSASCSTLGSRQPPVVPPRESSASKEAQRFNAVGSFLMHRVLRKGKKQSVEESKTEADKDNHPRTRPLLKDENEADAQSSSQQRNEAPKTPEQTTSAEQTFPETQPASPVSAVVRTSTNSSQLESITGPPEQGYTITNMRVELPAPSSVYSPQSVSDDFFQGNPLASRTYTSPAFASKSMEQNRRDSQSTTHLSWHGRRSVGLHGPSASEPHLPLPPVQEDSTTDLRLSTFRYNAHHHLPDLKEESHEDSSLNTSASNLKNSRFHIPLGSGPNMRASADDAVVFSRRSSLRSLRKSGTGRVPGLLTIDISEGNLLDKLHDLPWFRSSRSLGDLRLDIPQENKALLPRAVSAGEARESKSECSGQFALLGVDDEHTRLSGADNATRRAYSPQIVAELEQLTIPSIGGLTERISEMMLSSSLKDALKQYRMNGKLQGIGEFPEEERIMEQALEEINEVQSPSQKRSSARLRALPGYSKMMMVEDDVYENLSWTHSGSRIDEVDGKTKTGESEARKRAKGKDTVTVTQVTTPTKTTRSELQPPSPAVLRPRSNTVSGNQVQRVSAESGLSSRRSLRSFGSTPTATDTRPWNFDKNYPWATSSILSVDISLPSPSAVWHSPRPGPSHLRNRLSDASDSTFGSALAATASPLDATTSSKAHRNAHRYSIFGRSGDQAHAVGERYPTSALSPPTAIFRDHLSTCDTSDDEDFTTSRNKTKLSLRKRFSSAAHSNTRTTPRVTRSKVNPAELASPATIQETSASTLQDRTSEARVFTSNRHTFRDAEGMTPVAYHRHRIIDSIKRWWHKGGELIRTISRRGHAKQHEARHD